MKIDKHSLREESTLEPSTPVIIIFNSSRQEMLRFARRNLICKDGTVLVLALSACNVAQKSVLFMIERVCNNFSSLKFAFSNPTKTVHNSELCNDHSIIGNAMRWNIN